MLEKQSKNTRLGSGTAPLAENQLAALQSAQEGAAPTAAAAISAAGAPSKRAEPNAELLLEKLREHILEKGASPLVDCTGMSAVRAFSALLVAADADL